MAQKQPPMTLEALGAILTAGRRPKEELSSPARAAILALAIAGISHRTIAHAFGVSPSTVSATLQAFVETKTLDSAHRTGRPRKLNERDSRTLLRITKQAPGTTYNELRERLPVAVSKATIRRTLRRRSALAQEEQTK